MLPILFRGPLVPKEISKQYPPRMISLNSSRGKTFNTFVYYLSRSNEKRQKKEKQTLLHQIKMKNLRINLNLQGECPVILPSPVTRGISSDILSHVMSSTPIEKEENVSTNNSKK